MQPFEEDAPSKPVRAWMRWLSFSVLTFIIGVLQYDNWYTEKTLLTFPAFEEMNLTWSGEEQEQHEAEYYDNMRTYEIYVDAAKDRSGKDTSSVNAFLELVAVDQVLDNMVTHHHGYWIERLNRILNRKLVRTLNKAMGDMFTIESLSLNFSEPAVEVPGLLEAVAINVTQTGDVSLLQAPTGASQPDGATASEMNSTCVTATFAFMYNGLVQLRTNGVRHLGSGRLPILVRVLERVMMGFGRRRQNEVALDDLPPGDYGMSIDIGAKLAGPVVISVDITSSTADAWPSPRRVRISHVAPLELQRKLVHVSDDFGVLKRILAVAPSSLLVRRLEKGLNRLLYSYFSQHAGWEIPGSLPKASQPKAPAAENTAVPQGSRKGKSEAKQP